MIAQNKKNHKYEETEISTMGITRGVMTGRAGLVLFVHSLSSTAIYTLIKRYFGSMRKSKKGTEITNIFKQLFCFFLDGTAFHITQFDALKDNKG